MVEVMGGMTKKEAKAIQSLTKERHKVAERR